MEQVILRPYQEIAVMAGLKGLQSASKRALVVMATGLGKTLTSAFIAKKFCVEHILFLVHNNFILKHAHEEFQRVFDKKTSMAIYNGISKKGARETNIVFATWQTMGANLDQWGRDYFDLIIIDEAHHTEADTYRPTADYFTGAKLGITATPDREDEADIREVFGNQAVNITLEEAIAHGWLPRIEYHVVTDESLDDKALQKIVEEISEGKKRFTMAEVNRRIFIRKRDIEIARIINGYNEKAIVFCASIRHAERMKKSLKLAATFHSETGISTRNTWCNNQKVLSDLKDGIIRRVCAVNAFNEGVNAPSVGLVAFCRVTGVLVVFRQQLGRGLRPGKDKLIVLDFVGNLERIQLVLEMMNKVSDLHEEFTSKDSLRQEGYVRQRFEVSGKGFEFTFSNKVVDLMKVLEHCEREFYTTWQKASKAAIALRIRTTAEYKLRYKEDLHLPCAPIEFYSDFPGWTVFLGRQPKDFYPTWQEASKSSLIVGIKSSVEYFRRYKKDSRLPCDPHRVYPNFPGWKIFLGNETRNPYTTCQRASKAAVALEIATRREYNRHYKEDARLPSDPTRFYSDFPGWTVFLGRQPKDFYSTWQEASKSARVLGIKNKLEYTKRYKEDPRLPAVPSFFYDNFPCWPKFLGKV